MPYVDGTFETAPTFFHQLFTIHGHSIGHYVPLAFFLLANKQRMSYEDVFRHKVSEAAKLGVNVFPTVVYAVRTAINNAAATAWPGYEVKACPFHLGQRWWRKIQSLGLKQAVWKERVG